jgi:protocatechuate 3,4-dioxygenase beta subunit
MNGVDFHNVPLLCINGTKIDDCTGLPLAGWTINLLNASGSVIATTTTDSAGRYSFCRLESGNYTVCEVLQAGWKNVTPICLPVKLVCVDIDDADFHNVPLLCINGTKIDGLTQQPLAGWTINLYNASGSVIATTTTDGAGRYSFCGLESGNYTVCELLQAGWTNVTAVCIDVELECDDKVVDFENVPKLCINGTKINNCTGEALAGWTIELKDNNGAVITTTVTDANGDYSFCELEPGNYTVCEVLQSGWKNVSSLCIPVSLVTDDSEDNDFANDPPICINGTKINDCTDEGIAGWKIFLYDANGVKIGEAITDADGKYSFCGLKQGIYYVCEEEKEGWKAVRDETGAVIGSAPSDGMSQPPVSCDQPWCDDNCVCVNLDCEGAEVDFRNIPESLCINGSKINNCTGAGIEKWGIYLYDVNGEQIAATLTDRNGHYSFCGLPPGQYRVCEEIRDGWVPVTYINHSSASCLPEECTCDVCNNCIPVILNCSNSEGNDFENIPPLSIRGKVIDDCTGLGLKGWTVNLYDDKGTKLTSRTTGTDGSYVFTSSTTGGLKLTAGTLYSVCEVVKDGYTPVTYHANNSSPAMSNEYCIPVFLDCGETEVEDFENIPPLLISGHEFNQCTGEGLDGWTVHLKDGAGNILDTTTTDDTGYYEFSGLKPGWYTVCEDSIPEGWTSFRDAPVSPAMALPGTSGAPEDCETAKCIVVNLDYCEESTDNDFENIPPFCINGTVYNNSTEVVGFPIKIENSDGTQVLSIPTDAYGEYKFCGLKAGTYTVCVDKPGWTADEPCVIVYLDCMDEQHDFDVYKGRSNILPGIEQPAITIGDTSGAVVEGDRSGEPSEPTEPEDTGGREPGF